MTPSHARYAVCMFVLLSAGVASNIMLFQDIQGGRTSRHGAIDRLVKQASEPANEPAAEQTGTSSRPLLLNAQPVASAPAARTTGVAAEATAAAGGDAPDVIAAIQRELQARGYEPGTPDGLAGAVTRAAIMAWERDHGLEATGEPTEAVMKTIVLGVSPTAAAQITAQWQALPKERRARLEQMIRMVQQQLSALGYNLGKVTGRVNDDTGRAIREFETDQNITVSGRISGPLVARLARLTAAGRPTQAR